MPASLGGWASQLVIVLRQGRLERLEPAAGVTASEAGDLGLEVRHAPLHFSKSDLDVADLRPPLPQRL